MSQQSFTDPEPINYIRREWMHKGVTLITLEKKKAGWVIHSRGERDATFLSSGDAEAEYYQRMIRLGGHPPHNSRIYRK